MFPQFLWTMLLLGKSRCLRAQNQQADDCSPPRPSLRLSAESLLILT